MELGERLKQARQARELSQEALAARLGVSRQTISNWENQRSYPDIVSLIALSDLYSISLDELVKGDKNMIRHLEESTNVVKSRTDLSKTVIVAAYLILWTLSILFFWLGGRRDAMGYSLLIFYFLLPVGTLILSVFIGLGRGWENRKWLMLLFFGGMNMLAPYATFSLANMASVHKFNLPELTDMLPGVLCAGLGIAVGTAVRAVRERREP